MSAWEKLYDSMFTALTGYPGLVGSNPGDLVPEENVRPTDDPLEPVSGESIVYSISSSREDLKARRFEAVVAVVAGSALSKLRAHEIMSEVRRALLPTAMRSDGLLVKQFREQATATDAGKVGESWRVVTAFDVKFVEGSL